MSSSRTGVSSGPTIIRCRRRRYAYQDPSIISLTLEDKDQWVPGQLTLVFDNTEFALQQWVIIDGQGNRTSVHLTKLETDVEPDPKLFKVELPREIDNDTHK
jgi:outer membrane lipoprotein-sorting protein